MGKKKNRRKNSSWIPQKGASSYFSPASDVEFKSEHPVGYFFLVVLGIAVLIIPMIVYGCFVSKMIGDEGNVWLLLGVLGSVSIGIGLFNFVAIIIKQYLGHLVSILTLASGALLIWISLVQMGIV